MIVTIRGESHECRTATMENGKVTLFLGEYDEQGNESTSVFIGFSADEIIGIETEPEPPSGDDSVWDELDAAYREGYQEGVDSV